TSTVSTRRPPDSNGRRVQSNTLLGSGSPDATPSGYNSRRSCQSVVDARARPPHASEAPIAAASCTNSRRLIAIVYPPTISPQTRPSRSGMNVEMNNSCGRRDLNPSARIGRYEFEAIHPFEDDNGTDGGNRDPGARNVGDGDVAG